MIRAALLLLRVLWAARKARPAPGPVCRECATHALINVELNARLIECQIAARPIPRLWVATDQASPPPDAPPLAHSAAWTSLYEASDGEGIGAL